MKEDNLVSDAFRTFQKEAPSHAAVWNSAIQGLAGATALDKKTAELAYLAVLAALRMEGGIPFHVKMARQAGASREEVISTVLIGLPLAGNAVIQVLPRVLQAYDSD